MSDKVIHRGLVANGEDRITIYYSDNSDSLPADIRGYTVDTYSEDQWSWMGFFVAIMQGEEKGFRYNVQIGDLFYETKDDDG